MQRLICLLLLTLVCSTAMSRDQQAYSFRSILNTRAANKTFVSKSRSDTTRRTYLGKITGRDHRTIYYVIKEFNKIKAASTWHGHSNIYFFNAGYRLVASVDVGSPEDLPVRLKNNTLYFHDDNSPDKLHGVKITNRLPKFICIRPNDCEEVMPESR
jgi:hypothetical protein